jgi:hypothetical protein
VLLEACAASCGVKKACRLLAGARLPSDSARDGTVSGAAAAARAVAVLMRELSAPNRDAHDAALYHFIGERLGSRLSSGHEILGVWKVQVRTRCGRMRRCMQRAH